MKAVWYEAYGPAREVLKFGELDTPEPGSGEVRVRLYASGANPSDYKARLGSRGEMSWPRVIPQSDGAGVVESVGDGVDASRVGERVWIFNGQWQRAYGTAAEFIVVPERQAVPLADSVDFAQGACLAIPAMTAHRALFLDGPITGQTALVTGGAGAVGRYGVQLGKWGGAEVIATVSNDEKAEIARDAGADHVVNYRDEDAAERIMEITGGAGVDRICEVDFGDNLDVTRKVLKGNGTVAAYGSTRAPEPALPWYQMMPENTAIRMVFVYTMPDSAIAQACADINAACGAGALTHHIGARFSLEDTAAAHEIMESFTNVGNVVVEID
ncbi:MAG: NADPH:quinone reductase [Nitrospinae bacterium]|nr:NADPH:quinone reductase [Nitrospinota bacterium]